MTRRSLLTRQVLGIVSLSAALVASSGLRADAASFTWSGGGANGLWSNAANWAPGLLPASGTNSVTYDNAVNTTGTAGSGYTLDSLTYAASAGSHTINGATTSTAIAIRGNIANNSTSTQFINTRLNWPTGTATGSFSIGGAGNIVLGAPLAAGSGVTLTATGGGIVTLVAASPSFQGLLTTSAGGVIEAAGSNSASVGSFTNNGSLLVNGDFEIVNAMTLASTGTVLFQVPADPANVNTVIYGEGSSYGGTLHATLSGTYTGATLATATSFQLFNPVGTLASGGFNSVTGFYAGTPLTFSEIGGNTGYWASTAISGTGPQAGQYLVFEESTGVLMVVPEPSAVVIAGVGVALAGWQMARRRKGSKARA